MENMAENIVNLEEDKTSHLWKKGDIPNPKGRPKGRFTIKGRIIKLLEERPDLLQEMVEYLVKNEQALILQMIDGRPSQSIEGQVQVLPFNFIIEKAEPNKLLVQSTETKLIED